MNFRSIPVALLLVACAHGHEGSAHEAAPGQAGAKSTASVPSAAEPAPEAPATGPALAQPSPATLDVTLSPRVLPEAPKALLELDWEHALTLAEPKSGKQADTARVRAATLDARVSVALRAPSSSLLWLAVDGFTPRRVDANKGAALSALVPELTVLTPGVHRVLCFATDTGGTPLGRSDGSPLATQLAFEYAPAGSAPVGASKFHEQQQAPLVVEPRGTFNAVQPSEPVALVVWHADPEQALLLRIEDAARAQAFLQLKRGSHSLGGLASGDYHFSLAAAGATDGVEWTISVNRDLAPAKPTPAAGAAPTPRTAPSVPSLAPSSPAKER